MKKKYSDGMFCVCPKHGFLPKREPLKALPTCYVELQDIVSSLPKILSSADAIVGAVRNLPNYADRISEETDPFVLGALFRGYAFVTSAYLLEPCQAVYKSDGHYGQARKQLPRNVAEPFSLLAAKLSVKPWIDYHYAHGLGNYHVVRSEDMPSWRCMRATVTFTDVVEESNFIMVHVSINHHSPDIVRSIHMFLNGERLEGLTLLKNTLLKINIARKEIFKACPQDSYELFRTWMMGPYGNKEIFGEGVVYEGISESPSAFRGTTAAQDDIIPTCDTFLGIDLFYPENELTKYILEMRRYRPKPVRDYLEDLKVRMTEIGNAGALFTVCSRDELASLLDIAGQVYDFRQGHLCIVQKYVLGDNKLATGTGGSSILAQLPNQIEACLRYIDSILDKIDHRDLIFESHQRLQKQRWSAFNRLLSRYTEKE